MHQQHHHDNSSDQTDQHKADHQKQQNKSIAGQHQTEKTSNKEAAAFLLAVLKYPEICADSYPKAFQAASPTESHRSSRCSSRFGHRQPWHSSMD